MSVAESLVFFVLALGLSLTSSLVLARNIDRIGKRLGLPEPLLGLLTAFGADSPEISTAIVALQSGRHDIGAGVVFGSNLYNLAALLGGSAVVAGRVRLRRAGLVVNGVTALAVSAIAAALVLSGLTGLGALGLVLAVFVPYVVLVSSRPERIERRLPPGRVRRLLQDAVRGAEKDVRRDEPSPKAHSQDVLSTVPALASVALASVALVHTVTDLGDHFGVPDPVLGMLVLATLTGIPNLTAAIRLARRGRGSAVVSESLNSNTINVVVGLVVPAVVVGVGRPGSLTRIGALWLVALTATTLVLTGVRGGLRRREGLAVMVGYLAFAGLVVAS